MNVFMPRCLFTVEDTFIIKGPGLIPVPGVVPIGKERFRIGDPLLLKRPDGTSLGATIDGLELLCPNPRGDVVILLKDFSKENTPVGTEVWSVTETVLDP
jgi:hypothetical protein